MISRFECGFANAITCTAGRACSGEMGSPGHFGPAILGPQAGCGVWGGVPAGDQASRCARRGNQRPHALALNCPIA